MNYKKIGAFLKKEREQKGLSYYQVFETTRIQPSIIRSIEEGEPQISEVFFKNFIKTYMKFLGLDLQSVLKENNKKKSLKKEEEPVEVKKKNFSKLRFFKLCLVATLSFAVFFIIFSRFFFAPSTDSNESPTTSSATWGESLFEDLPVGSGSLETGKESQREKLEPFEDKKVEDKAAQSKIAYLEKKTESQRGESLASNQISSQSLFRKIRKLNFQHEIMIKSLEPLKIYFKIDRRSTLTKELSPSIWFVIKAKESLYLRFDEKVNQVEMFYNGVKWNFTSSRFFEKTFKTQPVKP